MDKKLRKSTALFSLYNKYGFLDKETACSNTW